jgi:hypothetical protein
VDGGKKGGQVLASDERFEKRKLCRRARTKNILATKDIHASLGVTVCKGE